MSEFQTLYDKLSKEDQAEVIRLMVDRLPVQPSKPE